MIDTATNVVGKRVKVTGCDPHRIVGSTGVVTDLYAGDDSLVYVKLDPGCEIGPHSEGRWVISGWEVLPPIEQITRENAVGKTLVAKYVPGFPEHEGKEFVVIEVHDDTTDRWTRGLCVQGAFEPDGALWVHEWDVPAEPVEDETVRFIREKDEEIERLKKLLEDERGRLRESQRYYSHDLTTINQMANQAADDQDWCGTYEDTLESMNARLIGGFTLVGRSKDWTVDATEYVLVAVRRSWSGEARDSDGAIEAAAAYFEEHDVTDDDVIAALREYAEPEHERMSPQYDWTVEEDN